MAGELGAEAQIPVLAVGDEVLVEEPYLLEERFTVECRGGARPEDVAGPVELSPVALAVTETVRKAAQAHGVSGSVQHPAVVEVH